MGGNKIKQKQAFQLLSIAIFFIVTTLTYGIVTPVKSTTDVSFQTVPGASANTTTNTTASMSDNTSQLGSIYQLLTAVTTGGIVAVIVVFFLKNKAIENKRKPIYAGKNK